MAEIVLPLSIVAASFFYAAFAFGPIPLQDFCVVDPKNGVIGSGGRACKDPPSVTADDFYYAAGLHQPTNISKILGSGTSFVSVNQIPGLNGQGILIGRADYVPNGYTPPHIHSKATEIVVLLEGTLAMGFVTSYPGFVHYNKTLNPGDVFVVPQGLIHYLYNVGKGNAAALFAFNTEEAQVIPLPYNIFGAKPDINTDFLASAFQLDKKIIEELQAKM